MLSPPGEKRVTFFSLPGDVRVGARAWAGGLGWSAHLYITLKKGMVFFFVLLLDGPKLEDCFVRFVSERPAGTVCG